MGTLSKLRRLVLREGVSVREAAQRLGIARNTASRWLALVDVTEPRYPKRVPAKSILEPFKEQMILWLKADLHRGKRDRRTTKEIFEAIRELGYVGSRGPVYEYCKYWREQQKTTPRHAGFVPLSFELGEAFQFDWSCEYAVVEGQLLKQAIKVGDSGALALRLKEQRQVEQSYRKETKKQQYHKTYPQSCNKTSTTKWLTFKREVWLCLVSESTIRATKPPKGRQKRPFGAVKRQKNE